MMRLKTFNKHREVRSDNENDEMEWFSEKCWGDHCIVISNVS